MTTALIFGATGVGTLNVLEAFRIHAPAGFPGSECIA